MRVLVTGAGGFLGRALCRELAEQHAVVGLDLAPTPPPDAGEIEWLVSNLSQPLDHAALPTSVDAVVHLAQSPRYRDMPDGFLDVFRVNTASTAELLDWAREVGAQRFVLASSGGVCAPQNDPVSEATAPAPPGPYPMSKLLAEKLVGTFAPHLQTTILRYFFIYGPGQRDRLVPNLIASVREGRPVTLRGEEGLRFNPIFVSDAAAATAAALTLDGHNLINVAGPETVSLRALVDRIGAQLGRDPVYETQPAPGPQDLVATLDRMVEQLGAPRIGIDEGLRRTLAADETSS